MKISNKENIETENARKSFTINKILDMLKDEYRSKFEKLQSNGLFMYMILNKIDELTSESTEDIATKISFHAFINLSTEYGLRNMVKDESNYEEINSILKAMIMYLNDNN